MHSAVKEKSKVINEDIALAQRICKELRAGNQEAIITIYDKYNNKFLFFTIKNIYHSKFYSKIVLAHEVLNDFWATLLSKNGKIICDYEAISNAQLSSYLFRVLYYHITAVNEKIKNEREREEELELEEIKASIEVKEREKRELKKLIHEALTEFSKQSAIDEKYIRMYFLEGLTYEEIARQELHNEKDEKVIKRKIDAIKKRFTRDKIGSMAKFKKILQEFLSSNKLDYSYALA